VDIRATMESKQHGRQCRPGVARRLKAPQRSMTPTEPEETQTGQQTIFSCWFWEYVKCMEWRYHRYITKPTHAIKQRQPLTSPKPNQFSILNCKARYEESVVPRGIYS
jgi:hypothetical protein